MTRRIPMLALIAPVLLVLLSACGSDTMSGYQRYEDDKNGFALQYPEDWEQLHGTGALVTFMAPAEPGSPGRPNATVTMEPVPGDMTPEAYLERAKPLLAQLLPKYAFGDQESVKVGGVDAVRYTYTIEIQEHRMNLVGYALLTNNKAYVITAGALADQYERYADTFEKICRSMEIL